MYFSKRKDKHAQFLFSLSTVHMYNFHIFTVIYSSFYRFIWNQHNDQLPVGLLAQLVEHCTGITVVMGSNPIQAWIFSGLIFTNAQVVFITAKIAFIYRKSSGYVYRLLWIDCILTGIESGMPAVFRLAIVWIKRGRYLLNADREDVKFCKIQGI